MNPTQSAGLFYAALARYDYNNTDRTPGSYAQQVQQSAFPRRYDERMVEARRIYDRLAGSVVSNRPDFNEYPMWSANYGTRGGVPVDLFLLHTQEGDGDADSLARWLQGAHSVSYHYTVSEAPDHGVTVVDVVDTDLASWSVLSANPRSINLCFAGSRVSWSRQQWLERAGNAIEVAAYLAVQDCRKYGFPATVLGTDFPPPGISDHSYVTNHLGVGDHTDVGYNFPWDVFTRHVHNYDTGMGGDVTPDQDDMIREIHAILTRKHVSLSMYRNPDEQPVGDLTRLIRNVDAMTHQELVERLAMLGDDDAIHRVARVAAGQGADTNPELVEHATKVLNRIPADVLKAWSVRNQ